MPRFRVVTACYKDESILNNWIPVLDSNNVPYTVYFKDDSLTRGQEEILNDYHIKIPNYGRCDYAFLYHIVKNYNSLDDITLFVKNNWQEQHIRVWDHINECQVYDFMESGKQRRFQYWSNKQDIYPRHEEIHTGKHIFAQTTIDWYHEIFPGIEPPIVVPGWGMAPCFSVSRRLIHRHPKSVYETLLEKFYPEGGSWDIEKGKQFFKTMEEQIIDIGKHYHDCFLRFWQVLFTHNLPPNMYRISDNNWNPYD